MAQEDPIDQSSGNWYQYVSNEEIGLWPSSRFKESSGTGVEWGGEVYDYDSYIRDTFIIDENYQTDNTVKNTESYTDNSHGYKVRDSTEHGGK
ncbi:unnamed protein product [Eruca vesicaria subsp. sativa]|uniref:Neprosin PEP catalytic domain-containing protein n=1 Tax=Eruca vesicaria subsp. sativa TaxID=29727 RepID=A0ABC8K7Y4_ERUVS|nr:unnamed protein product [Eruca vesicaria subsp. sativa]